MPGKTKRKEEEKEKTNAPGSVQPSHEGKVLCPAPPPETQSQILPKSLARFRLNAWTDSKKTKQKRRSLIRNKHKTGSASGNERGRDSRKVAVLVHQQKQVEHRDAGPAPQRRRFRHRPAPLRHSVKERLSVPGYRLFGGREGVIAGPGDGGREWFAGS